MAGEEMRFTVVGSYSGKTFAANVTLDEAAGWGLSYDIPRSELRDLPPEAELRSHEDSRGITIRRIA